MVLFLWVGVANKNSYKGPIELKNFARIETEMMVPDHFQRHFLSSKSKTNIISTEVTFKQDLLQRTC